jgi:hypothetical protein
VSVVTVCRSPEVAEAFFMVGSLVKPMRILFTPWAMWQAAKQVAREAWRGAERLLGYGLGA